MVFQMGGQVSIFENGARASIGNLTQQEVLASRSSAVRMDFHEARRLAGSGFFDDLKKFANTVSRGIQSGADFVGNVASAIPLPFAQQVAGVARGVGGLAGTVRNVTGGRMAGGRASGGRMSRLRM
jgi:hypothetical protein